MIPSTIQELVYDTTGAIDSTRTTNLGSSTCYWRSRNLPASGYAALDSTIDGNNCEVVRYKFAGHGSGNYVTNFKYYVANRNSVAQDMSHHFRVSSTFTAPSTYDDDDIYLLASGWERTPTSSPGASNVSTHSSYAATDDPTYTQYIYNAVIIGANKTTGTATWDTILLYQYT